MSEDGPLIPKGSKIECVMHNDIEDEAKITSLTPMRLHTCRNILFWIIVILTCGIFYLLSYWWPNLRLKFIYVECSVDKSTHVLAISKYFQDFAKVSRFSTKSQGNLTVFHYQQLPYFFDGNKFVPLVFDSELTYKDLIDLYNQGISDENEIVEKRTLFGICLILVDVQPLGRMVVKEIFNPFYIFQVYSVLLWIYEEYYGYTVAIIIITVISLISSIVTTRRGEIALHYLAKKTCRVKVVRNNSIQEMESTDLVPGDLVEINSQMELPCDLVLISGGCIVEEGMLTGESVPVIKDCLSYLSDVKYDVDVDRRHTLYEGTKIIQTRNYSDNPIRAVVVRTGFKTVKGRLIRSIMYPKPNKFKFYEDSLKFIGFLAFLTVLGFAVTIPRMIYLEYEYDILMVRTLDLITITVPPALPACMAAGVAFAITRLKKERIFCISPNRVNVAGRIDMFVFDKTGTLTEDGMNLLGAQAMKKNKELEEIKSNPKELSSFMVECMATCHSLALVNEQLIGDTQDLQIFKATKWLYDTPDKEAYDPLIKAIVRPAAASISSDVFNSKGEVISMIEIGYELGILHLFHFTSKLKRMGAIVKNLGNQKLLYYSKGAPEVLLTKCHSVPADINKILANYTKNGYRVLACAYKELDHLKYTQMGNLKIEDLEDGLEFIGLIILQNKLKPATIPTLEKLNSAGIKTLMATGDAILTGISVGRECGIINSSYPVYLGEMDKDEVVWELFSTDEASKLTVSKNPPWLHHGFEENYILALTGAAFAHLISEAENSDQENTKKTLQLVLEKCQIFARMAPEHKTLLVEKLQSINYLVGMCGDGANDCGALKAADIGVSLSEADSSIAAPFTSQVADISSVLIVLREGRCALTTSIQCFKFMALYSMIQFTSVSFLYWWYGGLTNNQFLTFDLFTVLPLSLMMSMTGPYSKLSKLQPPGELISFRILFSVTAQALLQAIFQFGAFFVSIFTYYSVPNTEPGVDPGMVSTENTIIIFMSWAQYIIVCATFSIGKPWKKSSISNKPFTIFQIFIGSTFIACLFYNEGVVKDWLEVNFI